MPSVKGKSGTRRHLVDPKNASDRRAELRGVKKPLLKHGLCRGQQMHSQHHDKCIKVFLGLTGCRRVYGWFARSTDKGMHLHVYITLHLKVDVLKDSCPFACISLFPNYDNLPAYADAREVKGSTGVLECPHVL